MARAVLARDNSEGAGSEAAPSTNIGMAPDAPNPFAAAGWAAFSFAVYDVALSAARLRQLGQVASVMARSSHSSGP